MLVSTRPARLSAVSALMLVGALAPLGAAETATAAPDTAVAARADRTWHPTMKVGTGKRAVTVVTCRSGGTGNYTARFKVSTRASTDRRYPRVEVSIVDGSHTSGSEFSLMPGRRTARWSDGLWTSAAVVTFKVHRQGKTTKKTVTVGSFGGC